jgi:D-glycero-D-manno-heptose 1,7-bisphosphate phosphatase
MTKRCAVFLDRDGTIIEDVGYIKDPVDIKIYPESYKALDILKDKFLLFIITNQSGISKGFTTEDEVNEVNKRIIEMLKINKIYISDVFCCPHSNEDECICKKPSPYFINLAAEKYNLNLNCSFIIGDHPSDVNCGINAGIEPFFLLTGHGRFHVDELRKDVKVFNTILDAAVHIINLKDKLLLI